jgi:endogenous inhibitor of DNA gyrase (YacG/DUF329 family)
MTLKDKRPGALYCSHRCRQAAYRARFAQPDQGATLGHCAHCGGGYFADGKGSKARKYCSASCRTLAARARREAAIMALADWQGIDAGRAADLVEIGGMKRTGAALAAAGFVYDERARRWGVPAWGDGIRVLA